MNEEDSGEIGYNKNKKKALVKGTIKLLKVYRNSRAELRIWPSS
jgi:hypothetical protein